MKPVLIFFSLFTALSAFAQDDIQLSGQILNPKSKAVHLNPNNEPQWKMQRGDSAVLDEQGRFTFTLPWTEARAASFQAGDETTELFLAPGDRLVLTLDTKEFDESLKFTGTGSTVNSYLAKKFLIEEKGEQYVSLAAKKPEAEFVRIADSVHTARLALLNQHFKGRKLTKAETAFTAYEKDKYLYEWAQSRLMYPEMHNYHNKSTGPVTLSKNYYDFLKKVPVQKEQATVSGAYVSFAVSYARHLAAEEVKKQPKLKDRPSYVVAYEQAEKTFKGPARPEVLTALMMENVSFQSDITPLQPAYERFLKEPGLNKGVIKFIDMKWQTAQSLTPGKPAPDFTATTAEGKEIKLSDYKGKVVFVDVWASWCGPCVKEIPSAKELETAFHGKDVVFLNVSIDDSADAWRKGLAKHDPKGINALAPGAWSSTLVKSYGINGIPRYLLIDRQGNLISSNAERPSGGAKQAIADALGK